MVERKKTGLAKARKAVSVPKSLGNSSDAQVHPILSTPGSSGSILRATQFTIHYVLGNLSVSYMTMTSPRPSVALISS